MPLTPSGARTFLHALSDFWTVYFRDTASLNAYAEGLALNAAQLYQGFLETVLGTSLAECPAFDRTFYAPLTLREDQVRFREGEGPDDDLWLCSVTENLVGAQYLQNRILIPTAVRVEGRDFVVERGQLAFRADPFAGLFAYFPSRTVRVSAPAAWVDPLRRTWDGARPGDSLRVTLGSARVTSTITGVWGSVLYLDEANETLRRSLLRRNAQVVVLRTPYNTRIEGAVPGAHPLSVARLTSEDRDGVCVPSATEADLSTEPSYLGAWAPGTLYPLGVLVSQAGNLWRCVSAHTSGVGFDAAYWDDLAQGHWYVEHPDDPRVDGVWAASTPTAPDRIAWQGVPFGAGAARVRLHRVLFSGSPGALPTPSAALPHSYLDPSSLEVRAFRAAVRRTVDSNGAVTEYPAGGTVLEGVDYLLDADSGILRVLSPWDPARAARASYTWKLLILRRSHVWRGDYVGGLSLNEGDLILQADAVYVSTLTHVTDGVFDSRYVLLRGPAVFGFDRDVQEISVWGTDVLTDPDRLYENFGAFLGRPRVTSEAYRELLRATARLFLLGPSFDRFESALNAVAELPLIRDDGEKLLEYSSGFDVTETGGELLDEASGADGELVVATGSFTAPTARFLATDVGATVTVQQGFFLTSYVVTGVTSLTTVTVHPPPLSDVSALRWHFKHLVSAQRLRVSGTGYRFTSADLGALVELRSATKARNQGIFRIVGLDDPLTALLDTPWGFEDEVNVPWALSRTGEQRVTTDRGSYVFSLTTPLRDDVKDPASLNSLTFASFEALSTAFTVVDYLEDPLWWRHITLPESLFSGEGGRRVVTPELIEHIYGAMDRARYGDAGMYYGQDDTGQPDEARAGSAVWFGGASLMVTLPAGLLPLGAYDLGKYVTVSQAPFKGHFRVASLDLPTGRVDLERFPPPEARGVLPPVAFPVRLPPRAVRRTVAFVAMDRLLKYHSIKVQVDPRLESGKELLDDILRVVDEATPTHLLVFFDTPTDLQDELIITDELEFDVGHNLPEALWYPPLALRYAPTGLLRYGDAYRFVGRTTAIPAAPGVHLLPTVLPGGVDPVRTLVKAWLEPAARVDGVRRPAEGVDYEVNYVDGELTITTTGVLTPDPVTVHYVDCIRRILAPAAPHDPTETNLVYGGADPTVVRAPLQLPEAAGLVDRAVQLTLGP